MPLDLRTLHTMIKILRSYYRGFRAPSVTEVSHHYHDPYHVLISCILSQRTKDETTAQASRRLFLLAPSLARLARLPVKKIERAIYPVGFYRTKAKNIKLLANDIIARFQGVVPDDLDSLLSLQGVGRKTANLVLTLGFHKLGICVDTHVHRISNRFGFVRTKTPFDTEMRLRKILPKKFWIEYNDLLVAFGQNICTPISPFCSRCRLFRYCPRLGVLHSR